MSGDFSSASVYKHRDVYLFFVLPPLSLFSSDQVHGIYLKVVLCGLSIPESPNSRALARVLVALSVEEREH